MTPPHTNSIMYNSIIQMEIKCTSCARGEILSFENENRYNLDSYNNFLHLLVYL